MRTIWRAASHRRKLRVGQTGFRPCYRRLAFASKQRPKLFGPLRILDRILQDETRLGTGLPSHLRIQNPLL